MSTQPSHLFCFEGGLGARRHSCLSFPSPAGSSLLHHFSKQGSPSDRSLTRGDVPRDSTSFPAKEQRMAEKSLFYSHFPVLPLPPTTFKMWKELEKKFCQLIGAGWMLYLCQAQGS